MPCIAVFVFAIGASNSLWPALAACIGVGFGAGQVIVPGFALLQTESHPDVRGRVMSLSAAMLAAAQGVALFLAGDVSNRLGIVPVYYGSAGLLLILAGAGYLRLRQLLRDPAPA